MNLHAYKKSHKKLIRTLDAELSKPEIEQNSQRIRQLTEAKRSCANKIRELKNKTQEKRVKHSRKKRFRGTIAKGRRSYPWRKKRKPGQTSKNKK